MIHLKDNRYEHIIVNVDEFDNTFLPIDNHLPLQVGIMKYDWNLGVSSHVNVRRSFGFTGQVIESWYIVRGSFRIKLYDLDQNIIFDEILSNGTLIYTVMGGHGFTATEPNSMMLEFKTAPYDKNIPSYIPIT